MGRPVFGLQHTISATVTTVGATCSGMFPHSSPLVLWITMELYTLAMIAAAFVVSALFKTAKPAQGGAFIAYAQHGHNCRLVAASAMAS